MAGCLVSPGFQWCYLVLFGVKPMLIIYMALHGLFLSVIWSHSTGLSLMTSCISWLVNGLKMSSFLAINFNSYCDMSILKFFSCFLRIRLWLLTWQTRMMFSQKQLLTLRGIHIFLHVFFSFSYFTSYFTS